MMHTSLITLWLAGFGAALLFLFLTLWFVRRRKPSCFPYEKQAVLFTPAERAFFVILKEVVESQFLIFGKVRLADVIKTRSGLTPEIQRRAFYKITNKHLDFVICRVKDLSVIGVIELDDRSHDLPQRQARDSFVDGALAAARIPIAHIKVQRHYSKAALRAELAQRLGI